MTKKMVALCACPMGLAHTFMAAKAIEVGGKNRGYEYKVETQGSDGVQNKLSKMISKKQISLFTRLL